MKLHNWLKPHIWTDVGKEIMIGEYNCVLFWDEEQRHWRVELDKYGNVGRSQLSPEEAIIDAKATLNVYESPTSPDLRAHPKTGQSRDNLHQLGGASNRTGFANTLAHYLDPLDPHRSKLAKKPSWIKQKMHEKDCPPGFKYCSKRGKCIPQQDRGSKTGIVAEEKKEITPQEMKEFESRWKNKLSSYGLTNFEFSKHGGKLRLNHTRNNPPLTIEDLDFVMDGFIRKMGSQFKQDIENVKNNTAKKRGLKKQDIPHNNLEFTVKSSSNKVNFTFVLKQDRKKKGTAMILPITVMRKKNWKTTKGEEIIVERKEIGMDLVDKYLGEGDKMAGWIAMYNGKKLEIKKSEANGIYGAKQKAIKHFKIPKSKQGLLAIAPAYDD